MLVGWCGRGRSLLQAAALCVGMVGCSAQRGDSLRLSEELGHARAEAAWQQSRAAELESRVWRLEQRTNEAARARSAEDDRVLARLDQLVEMNESWLARRAAPVVGGTGAAQPQTQTQTSPVKGAGASSARTEAPAPSQEQQLRAIVEGLRGRPGRLRGTLTREQEDALRVLLRTERKLDAENPWSASFY